MGSHVVETVYECFLKPLGSTKESNQICNLSPWDISLLCWRYMQHGMLLKEQSTLLGNDKDYVETLMNLLKHTLSLTLFHFYPLAGRLVTQKAKDDPSSCNIFVDCSNSPGARFIYATLDMSISDIFPSIDVPPIVHSFFEHPNIVNYDGHTLPLLSVKVTKLLDGFFVGCSMNHAVGDGTSFFNFIREWIGIINAQADAKEPLSHVSISRKPIHNRWFPEGCDSFINLPIKDVVVDRSISMSEAPKLRVRSFHFSGESIAKLKAKANEEFKTTEISSFQSLVAHVWRCITRVRQLPYDQKTSCYVSTDNRPRMEPPLAEEYFGNAFGLASAESTAGELLEHDLGWAAWKVHLAIVNYDDKTVRRLINEWLQRPLLNRFDSFFDPCSVATSSSPRFNPYGQYLGTLKEIAVMSGFNNKFDGKLGVFPGHEGGGSIDIELSLSPHAMSALELDQDFMGLVSVATPLQS